ncbi:MAG: PAS domain S-box protein [Pseudorhodobacter sp.]|nr:PAS domain S-box protein [Pseudorhodobacter sp.]
MSRAIVDNRNAATGQRAVELYETAGRQGGLDRNEAWVVDADPSRPAAGGGSRIDLLSMVPLVAIAALVALVAALVWIVNGTESERVRAQLATDALWVEQTLRFQLSIDEDMLVRLALDQVGGAALLTLDARARLHIANNPEVLSVAWVDAAGNRLHAVPGQSGSAPADPALAVLAQRPSMASARPAYSELRHLPGQPATVVLAVRSGDGTGMVTATVALPLLFERHVPWWIAEKYAVELVDVGGAVLVARARARLEPGAPSHTISFDPPLPGMLLRITPYSAAGPAANTMLLAGIAGLSAFAILALIVLYLTANRRRRAELQLSGEMAFRHSMEESLTVGLRARDHQGRVLYVNSAFCQMVGLPASELVGRLPPMPYWADEVLAETLERQRAQASHDSTPRSFETRFRRSDGRVIDVQVFDAPLIDAKGTHRGWMGSIIDITEARRAASLARAQDASLQRTGRLVTLGEMASSLAHELNQPLAAIAGYAAGALNLIDAGQASPAALRPALEKLAHQASRAGQIIRRIQDFVRKREPRLTPLALAEVITDTVAFLAADARERHLRLITDLADVPPLAADRILIEQVLINLIRNGMEAMAPASRSGDSLTISLRTTAEGVEIAVADQGSGIDPALADRLFDAFSSTKTDGMGMGLNICRTIVELHRGHLHVRANPGGGTVFVVALPGAAAAGLAAR